VDLGDASRCPLTGVDCSVVGLLLRLKKLPSRLGQVSLRCRFAAIRDAAIGLNNARRKTLGEL
jgi:methyl coenzyme M reductase subunit C-like uncharacterized protein (methanogenesis marker protein 7)